MADDFDPFDDIFGDEPVKNARVVGKFRPKPKFQPQRKVSAKSSVATSLSVQTVHSAPLDSSEPIHTVKPLEQCSNVLPTDNAKRAGQTIDSAPRELSQPIMNAELLEHGSDAVPNDKSDSTNTCKVADVTKDSDVAAEVDALAAGERIVSSADVHDDIDGRGVIEGMDSINMTELTTKSEQGTGKFQPGPNLQMQKNMYEPSNSTSYSLDFQAGSLQPDSAENNFIPTSQNDDAVDLSSPGFTHTLPTESTSELPLDEESMNLKEVPQSDSFTHMEGLPEIPAKLASRRAKTRNSKTNAASDPNLHQQKPSTSSQENGTSRSLRPRKRDTSFCELVDEDGDETLASGENCEERPFSSAIDEENLNNEQPQVESESQKKNSKRKSKKTENDKDKPPRKNKKAKEASEQETRAKKKKFSHSTQRRRILDKNLLNIPEEEFDPREVSFRDLILLAEHREKQMKTGQATAPATHQSTGNSDYNNEPAGQYYNDPAGQYNNDEEDGPIAEDTTEYFNYQSRMEKTPRVRWSKQDTELFYEAVQQFGTDFSMIAQLFPGRSREQIRNKYKKEERQYPLRLREALTNRGKDLSYFGKVIENLNKIREQEELEDCTSTEGGPDEEASDADDDGGKHEHVEEEENGDAANNFTEVQTAAKPETEKEEVVVEEEENEEDEMLLWSQYKSDM
ncbi:transcription factor TFIIIB component B'' isoform X2 [Salvia miltiorrhiza]|uniref:transcription factor TFIIIB component B'' isoform X2 n=1 Tax=Salvia miltiorrhiza TaxID=226208 RepID=UPI0025ABFFC6|nr:transcription factor TFIIIB component B'' isoform X2 [Salvia miltiorrhiza]